VPADGCGGQSHRRDLAARSQAERRPDMKTHTGLQSSAVDLAAELLSSS